MFKSYGLRCCNIVKGSGIKELWKEKGCVEDLRVADESGMKGYELQIKVDCRKKTLL